MLARGHPAPSPGLQGHLVATQNQATPASEPVHSHTPRKPTKAPIRWSVRWHLRGCCNVECLVYKSVLNVSGLRTPLTQRFICSASDRTMAAAHKPCPPPSIMPRPCAPTRPRQDHVAPCPWLSRGLLPQIVVHLTIAAPAATPGTAITWILEQRPSGAVPGVVFNGTPSRHVSPRQPRRATPSTPTRIRHSLGHRATDDWACGMGIPRRRILHAAPTVHTRSKSTLHGKTRT
jgi:hypothetical protein